MKKTFFIAAILIFETAFLAGPVHAAGPTPIGGTQSGTLYLTNSPYIVTSDLFVLSGQSLTIEAGVTLQFTNANIGFIIDGTLVARGTGASPILFTSDKSPKQVGQWKGIYFRSSATNVVLDTCTVECGAASAGGLTANIRIENASSVLVTNCSIRSSFANGITILSCDPKIVACTFTNNGATNAGFAISMSADCLPTLRSNVALANGNNAIGIYGVNISRTGTWVRDTIPYTAFQDVVVNGGVTLTIEAGTVVQFQGAGVGLYVDGTLLARGAANNPIVFTSDKSTKQVGQWKGIDIRSAATTNTVLDTCVVECGAAQSSGFTENIRFESAPPVLITNCIVRSSFANGITIFSSDPRIMSCTFSNNGATNAGFAISMSANCLPILRNNVAQGNGNDAIGIFGVNVSRSGTWVRDTIPYTAFQDVVVNGGVTLSIEPGTVVQFQGLGVGMYVDGTLVARGTIGSPILLTSDKPVKQVGQWKGIDIRSSASTNTVLDTCIVECGAAQSSGFTENIRIENAPPVLITNCTVRSSFANGITMFASDPRIGSCTFSNNGATNSGFAISMTADSLPIVRNNVAQANGNNAIGIFGFNVSRSGTWVHDSIPYTAFQDVVVNVGVSLTIEPGTVIQFQGVGVGMYVDGTLVARGNANAPIVFTSDKAVKQVGQWKAIYIRSSSTNVVLDTCVVECAASQASGLTENIRIENAPPALITNCTIRSSFANGIRIFASDPRIIGCTFTNNGATNSGFAITMGADCLPTLRNNAAQANGNNAIGIFGNNITRSGSWVRDAIPYTAISDLVLNSGVSLTLETGTVIQFQDVGVGFYVSGTLVAHGTTNSPVLFTSSKAIKQPGQWKGIDIQSTATGTVLDGCIVEYGASAAGGFGGSLQFDFAPLTVVTNCVIRKSQNDGVYCNSSSPKITGCQIKNSGRDGIRTVNSSSPVITNCAIATSTGFGINNLDTSRIILARGNYWGAPSGPFDNSNVDGLGLVNPSGLGDKVSEYVDWSSFSTSDPTSGETPALLAIALGLNQAVLSWPDSVSGYSLQYVTNLPAPTNAWVSVTNANLIDGRYTVLDAPLIVQKYYRLIR